MAENIGLLQSTEDREEAKGASSPVTRSLTSKVYVTGCVLSFCYALSNSLNFVTTQVLDGITGVSQLSFGQAATSTLMVLGYMLKQRKMPRLMHKKTFGYFVLFLLSNMLYFICAFVASIHIALGTLNAIVTVTFVLGILCYTLLSNLYYKSGIRLIDIAIDTITVSLLCVSIIFLVQPKEIFGEMFYFNSTDVAYTSFCNKDRFGNTNVTDEKDTTGLYLSQTWIGYLTAALAGFCNTVGLTCIQNILNIDTFDNLVFWFGCLLSLFCLLATSFVGGFIFPQSGICMFLLFAQAITGGLLNCFYIASASFISPLDVAVISRFVLPTLFIFQLTFLKTISPAPNNIAAILAAIIVSIVIIGKSLIQWVFITNGY